MHGLSDEALFERWLENPYDQWFCGEDVFRHQLPFERSALHRWRRHVGEAALAAVLRDVLALADPAPDAIVDRGRNDAPALEPVRLV
jgi:IS5 family transposase